MKIIKTKKSLSPIKAVVMDFDGTISTLRKGWEDIMLPMFLEFIFSGEEQNDKTLSEVADYIDSSTGIQTIHQMNWLANRVKNNKNSERDGWWYKQEYNNRLMIPVNERTHDINTGKKNADDFMLIGSLEFLKCLKNKGIPIYIASGTDTEDVKKEADILGVTPYVINIAGAKKNEISCSKEAVLKKLIQNIGLPAEQIMVIGDGKVEISLAAKSGAFAVGIASDEEKREGINPLKEPRLINAGANIIIGDYKEREEIFEMAGVSL